MTTTITSARTPTAPATGRDTTAPDEQGQRTVPPAIDRTQYLQTLDQVEAGLDRAHQALHRSRRAPAGDRGQRLTGLHATVRAIGQVLNDAQGGWPPPTADDEAA